MSSPAHLSLADYDRMLGAGVFDRGGRQRLEFVRGEIREMTPIGPAHEEIVERLTEWSYGHLPRDRGRVRVQDSIGLPALESAPEPDIAWVARRNYSRSRPSPQDVLLVIEVAESSLAYDTGEKADLYAVAGIGDYWVVDLAAHHIEVRRDPHDGHYRSLTIYTGQSPIHPLHFPRIALHPGTLWDE